MNSTVCNNNVEHIYITLTQSDLEISKIKNYDWCIVTNKSNSKFIAQYNNGVLKFINGGGQINYNDISGICEKIIATTDTSLENIVDEKYPNGNSKGIRKIINLPSINQSFIKYFISEYNSVNFIKRAEFELFKVYENSRHNVDFNWDLKLNQQNEICITISLDDVWQSKIDIANKSELTTFIFNYNSYYYISTFDKGMWTYPIKIKYI